MGKKSTQIFNLGSGNVSATSFSVLGNEKIKLDNFVQKSFQPKADDDDWISQISECIKNISLGENIKGPVYAILPSNKLLIKTIRVPKVDIDKQSKIVSFELSQKMPFSLDEMEWNYQVIDDDGIEQEILTFAVKKVHAEKLSRVFFQNGMMLKGMYPSTILNHKTIESYQDTKNYSDIIFGNFGAKSTDLIFHGSTGFLVRNTPIGGSNLTQLISDSTNLTFDKAETLKIKQLAKINEGNTENRLINDQLQVAQTTYFTKLGQEISRAVVNYKRLKKGKLPQIFFITGQSSLIPGLTQFLGQCLQIPIAFLDPYKDLTVGKEVNRDDLPKISCAISESLSLAKSIFFDEIDKIISLLPQSSLLAFEQKKKIPLLIVASILFSFTPLPIYFSIDNDVTNVQELHRDLSSNISRNNQLINSLLEKQEKLNTYQIISNRLNDQLINLNQFNHLLYRNTKILDSLESLLQDSVVRDLWFDELYPVMEIESQYFSKLKLCGRYLVRLEENDYASPDDKLNSLIDKNTDQQHSLISAIKDLSITDHISKKSFSIEGKGDLMNRFYTQFEIEIVLK